MKEEHNDWRTSRYDPRIPLGMPRAAQVEYGLTVQQYFRPARHARTGEVLPIATSCDVIAVAAVNNTQEDTDV